MNNIYENQTIESLTSIVDALALATKVSRHSGFRFVYFGDNDNYHEQIRHFIQNRLSHEYSLVRPLTATEIDMLVERFIKTAHPAILSDEVKSKLRSEIPLAWSEIAG